MIRVRGIEIDRKTRTIRHAGRSWRVNARGETRWRYLCALILGGGLTSHQIHEIALGDRADGGLNWGPDGARTHIQGTGMRKVYEKLRLRLVASRVSESINRYELIPAYMERGSR